MKNKEIKFRVYCEKHSRWEYYSMGDLVCGATTTSNGEGGEFRAETWGLITGLKDSSGRDVFEGDIVSLKLTDGQNDFTYEMGVMEWDELSLRYVWNDGTSSDGGWGVNADSSEDIEIVGNLFENPELLKAEKSK